MEEKNQGEQRSGERRRSHGRRRRKNPNTTAPKQQERTRERSGHRKEREQKKHNGYQPDTGKDAIRVFDLGTYEEEGKQFLFHYDKGT